MTATNTIGAAGLVSRHLSSGSVFYDFDLSGSVCQRLSSSGGIVSYDYVDAFGARSTTDTTSDPFGFGAQWGGYTDYQTGLVLFTHRYYDPSTGRWLTRDPIGYDGGINVYGYVGNEPVCSKDSTGFLPGSCHGINCAEILAADLETIDFVYKSGLKAADFGESIAIAACNSGDEAPPEGEVFAFICVVKVIKRFNKIRSALAATRNAARAAAYAKFALCVAHGGDWHKPW